MVALTPEDVAKNLQHPFNVSVLSTLLPPHPPQIFPIPGRTPPPYGIGKSLRSDFLRIF